MKKIILLATLVGVTSQFLYADIVQGGLETSVSAGLNIPISSSQSGVSVLGGNTFSSFGTGLDLNLQTVYGLNENSGLGLGVGIMSISPTAANGYKQFYSSYLDSSAPDGTINILPIYAVYKYEFLNTQFNPFIQAKLGYAVPISSTTDITINNSSLNESFGGGMFLGMGAGAYLTNNIFLEADINYYQTTQKFTGSILSANNNMSFFTTGLQVGYTF